MITIYVPKDSSAVSVGAHSVASAIMAEANKRKIEIKLIRNGSRGAFFLEPLVEVDLGKGRVAFGNVAASDVASLFDANFGDHPKALGPTDEIAWLKNQERLIFARAGLADPVSVEAYQANGGYKGLAKALSMTGAEIAAEVTESGLRGRGGAGFPTGIKWKTVHDLNADQKYVCCNADEGDSGTFADRLIMEADPLTLIEGMTIAAICAGATKGYVYIRSEYPDAIAIMKEAIANAEKAGFLGGNICGSGKAFDLKVRIGAGAYICGEETAMLESIEGKRGMVRAKPPIPAIEGLFGKPTIINNVLSLASVPAILSEGAGFYKNYGMGRSRGTQAFQLAGNIKQGGLVEKAFGVSLRELVEGFGGGTYSGRPIRAVQVGGPLGSYLPVSQMDLPMDYETFAANGAMVGHGGIVVFDESVDMAKQARFAMEFCAAESCGKCTPCRIGSTRGVEVIDKIMAGVDAGANLALLDDLCQTMTDGSLCAMGGLTPMPVQSAIKHFPEDFDRAASAQAAE